MTKVLLVEDSPTQATQIAFFLEEAGLDVELARDGRGALEVLRTVAGIEIVASDIVMPGMSGYELCRALKGDAATREIPVILLTSLREPHELLEGLVSGADSFLSKPVDPDELVHRINSVLTSKELRKDGPSSSQIGPDDLIHFDFRGKTFGAPADPARLVNYFAAAFEDFLGAREREHVRALSETALRESTKLLQGTVDGLPEGIAVLDANGRILAVNAVWKSGGGENHLCNAEHEVGTFYATACNEVAATGDRAARILAQGLAEAIAGTRRELQLEYPVDGAAGRKWYAAHVKRVDDAGAAAVVVTHRDITERKRAEDAIRDSNHQLEQALHDLKTAQTSLVAQERLRALGQMASGIAHDFNNALAPVLGYSEQLLMDPRKLDDREKLLKRLNLIHLSAKDATKVVGRLREFARPKDDEAVLAPVALDELARTAIELTRPRWKGVSEAKGIEIQIRTRFDDVPKVAANTSEIREVLTNLIFNAIDAMPKGGTLTLATALEDGRVVLEVHDTGTGMTEEQCRRCLEPFFTTKGEHGTGLGLAMVYGIVQRHHGTLDIESEVGVGTAFRIRFPVASGAEKSLDDTTAPVVVHRLRVLVVDDEEVNRDVVGEYLRGDGHDVETAASGEDALARISAGGIDVVFTDRAMPGMSGDQVALGAKQHDASIGVILLTGFGELMEAAGEIPDGVDVVLTKPVSIAPLRRALAQVAPLA